eukprot:9226069-Karenia_brevis.AAC.1
MDAHCLYAGSTRHTILTRQSDTRLDATQASRTKHWRMAKYYMEEVHLPADAQSTLAMAGNSGEDKQINTYVLVTHSDDGTYHQVPDDVANQV